MDKVAWLVAGNKGGAGKSVVAKGLADWLRHHQVPLTVVEGDKRTPDVLAAYEEAVKTAQFDLAEDSGWAGLSDFLCSDDVGGQIVINLPDGISDRAVLYFKRVERLAQSYSFQVKALFVVNTLPDGLTLFRELVDSFEHVVPVKNLHFGRPAAFSHFDGAFGKEFEDRIVLFPRLNAALMMVVRESMLSYQDFIRQAGNGVSNFTYAKIAVADWRDSMFEALEDVLRGE